MLLLTLMLLELVLATLQARHVEQGLNRRGLEKRRASGLTSSSSSSISTSTSAGASASASTSTSIALLPWRLWWRRGSICGCSCGTSRRGRH